MRFQRHRAQLILSERRYINRAIVEGRNYIHNERKGKRGQRSGSASTPTSSSAFENLP